MYNRRCIHLRCSGVPECRQLVQPEQMEPGGLREIDFWKFNCVVMATLDHLGVLEADHGV